MAMHERRATACLARRNAALLVALSWLWQACSSSPEPACGDSFSGDEQDPRCHLDSSVPPSGRDEFSEWQSMFSAPAFSSSSRHEVELQDDFEASDVSNNSRRLGHHCARTNTKAWFVLTQMYWGEIPPGFNPGKDAPDFIKESVKICAMSLDLPKDPEQVYIAGETGSGYDMYFNMFLRRKQTLMNNGKPHVMQTYSVAVSNPALMCQIAETLYSFGCRLFLGPPNANATLNMVRGLSKKPDVAFIVPWGWHPSLAQTKKVFSLQTPPSLVFKNALETVKQAADDRGMVLKSVAMVQDSSAYGAALCASVKAWATSHGLASFLRTWANPADLRKAVQGIKGLADTPDIVVGCSERYSHCEMFAREIQNRSVNPKALILPPGCISNKTFASLQFSYAESQVKFAGGPVQGNFEGRSMMAAEPWVKGLSATANMSFTISNKEIANIITSFGANINKYRMLAFTAVDLLVHALQATPASDVAQGKFGTAQSVLASLHSLRQNKLQSILGDLEFDADGRLKNSDYAVQWMQATRDVARFSETMNKDANPAAETVTIVGPVGTSYFQKPIWFPKPTFRELQCLRSDAGNGLHGYDGQDISKETCKPCRRGYTTVTRYIPVEKFAPKNKSLAPILGVKFCSSCKPGRFWLRDIVNRDRPQCRDCLPGSYSRLEARARCETCQPGTFQSNMSSTHCELCPKGLAQVHSGSTKCDACSGGTVAAKLGATFCAPCPEGALCSSDAKSYTNKDGTYLLTKEQYMPSVWSAIDVTTKLHGGTLFKCPADNGKVCKASRVCESDGSTDSMYGPLCGVCKSGWEKHHFLDECNECAGPFLVFIFCLCNAWWIGVLISLLTVEAYTVGFTGTKQVRLICFKILVQYSILMATVSEVVPDLKIGDEGAQWGVGNLFFWTRLFGYSSPGRFELAASCQLRLWHPDTKTAYSLVTMAWVMIPTWVATLVVCFFLFRTLVNNFMGYNMSLKSLTTAFYVMIYVIVIRVNKMMRDVFMCRTYDASRLLASPDVFCQDDNHRKWQLIGGIGIVFWSCGIPLYILHALRSSKKAGKLDDLFHMKTLGFFYIGFRPECYFFEVVFMLRGVFFQSILGGPMMVAPAMRVGEPQPFSGAAVTMGLLIILCLFVHYLAMPYDQRAHNCLNRMEARMLWALLATVFGQALVESLDTTLAFENATGGARYWRNSILCVIVCIFHLVFLVEVAKGIWFSVVHHDEMYEKPLSIHAEGLDTKKLSSGRKRLFAKLIGDIAKLHVRLKSELHFVHFGWLLERAIIDTLYWKKLEKEVRIGRRSSEGRVQAGFLSRLVSRFTDGVESVEKDARLLHKKAVYGIDPEELKQWKKFIGAEVTVSSVYQQVTQHGPRLIEDFQEFKAKAKEARKSHLMSMRESMKSPKDRGRDDDEEGSVHSWGSDVDMGQAPTLGTNMATIGVKDTEKQGFIVTKETLSGLRRSLVDARKHTDALIQARGIYSSLGLSKSGHDVANLMMLPKVTGLNMMELHLDGACGGDRRNPVLCVCTVLGENQSPKEGHGARFQTETIPLSTDMKWDDTFQLPDFVTGDSLEITVWQDIAQGEVEVQAQETAFTFTSAFTGMQGDDSTGVKRRYQTRSTNGDKKLLLGHSVLTTNELFDENGVIKKLWIPLLNLLDPNPVDMQLQCKLEPQDMERVSRSARSTPRLEILSDFERTTMMNERSSKLPMTANIPQIAPRSDSRASTVKSAGSSGGGSNTVIEVSPRREDQETQPQENANENLRLDMSSVTPPALFDPPAASSASETPRRVSLPASSASETPRRASFQTQPQASVDEPVGPVSKEAPQKGKPREDNDLAVQLQREVSELTSVLANLRQQREEKRGGAGKPKQKANSVVPLPFLPDLSDLGFLRKAGNTRSRAMQTSNQEDTDKQVTSAHLGLREQVEQLRLSVQDKRSCNEGLTGELDLVKLQCEEARVYQANHVQSLMQQSADDETRV